MTRVAILFATALLLTGADWLADGVKPLPHVAQSSHPAEPALDNPPGFREFDTPQYPLAMGSSDLTQSRQSSH